MIRNDHKAKQSKAEMCKHMSALKTTRPSRTGLHAWGSTADLQVCLELKSFEFDRSFCEKETLLA